MAFLTKRFQYLTRKKKRLLGRNGGSKRSSYVYKKNDQKGFFNYKKLGHFIVDCPDLEKNKSKKSPRKKT